MGLLHLPGGWECRFSIPWSSISQELGPRFQRGGCCPSSTPQADPNPLPQTLPCVGSQGIGKVLKILRVRMSRQRTALNLWLGLLTVTEASWVALVIKNLPANARDVRDRGSIPGWGRSPG